MRIALLTPTYWPEVRRGTERVVHDLGSTLAARGHEVTLITTHPGRRSEAVEDGMRVIRSRRLPKPPGLSVHEYHLTSIPNAYRRLRRGGFDLAHSFFPAESWAAVRARRAGGPPVLASIHGIPTRQYLVARRYRLEMLLEVARSAEGCSVLSDAAARPWRRYLLRDPVVLPGGVLGRDFALDQARAPEPTLFCAASLGDPRKRADLLLSAFDGLRRRRPDAKLIVAAARDPLMSGSRPELPAGARWLALDDPAALAGAYAAAWATVNTAAEEAFGLVLVESLAAGTPVVADDSGAGPEIITDAVGRVFASGDAKGLERAMDDALDLGLDQGVADACRARAAEFDWERLVERYEDVYEMVAAGRLA